MNEYIRFNDDISDCCLMIYLSDWLVGGYCRAKDRKYFFTTESNFELYIIDDYGNLVYSGRNL